MDKAHITGIVVPFDVIGFDVSPVRDGWVHPKSLGHMQWRWDAVRGINVRRGAEWDHP